eukprot:gene8123-5659_t
MINNYIIVFYSVAFYLPPVRDEFNEDALRRPFFFLFLFLRFSNAPKMSDGGRNRKMRATSDEIQKYTRNKDDIKDPPPPFSNHNNNNNKKEVRKGADRGVLHLSPPHHLLLTFHLLRYPLAQSRLRISLLHTGIILSVPSSLEMHRCNGYIRC